MSKGKFSQPTGRSNALDTVQTSYTDALEVPFRSLKAGEGLVIRILSLSSEEGHMIRQPGVRASVKNTKPGADKPYFSPFVPLPADLDDADDIQDDEGNTLGDLERKESWLIPVQLLYALDADGFVTDEINELRYLKAGPGMVKDLVEMSKNVKDDTEFDSIPSYDIRIEALKGPIPNWSLNVVTKIITKDAKGKAVKENCPRLGEESLEKALGKETWGYIVDNMDDLIEHMNEVNDKERKLATVKKRFVRYRGDNANDANTSRSVGMRRDLPTNEPEDEPEAEAEADEPKESEPKFRGLGKGRFAK